MNIFFSFFLIFCESTYLIISFLLVLNTFLIFFLVSFCLSLQSQGGALYLQWRAAVTFNGNSNVMKSNTAFIGKNIYSESSNLKFSVCKPGTTSPGTLTGNLELDFDGCPLALCSWHAITNDGGVKSGTTGTHLVPAAGCKMSKIINVNGDMTINGESGSYRQLQSNRVDNQGVAASNTHRHFQLWSTGKLTLNYLKLSWGEVGNSYGGFIYMNSGTLDINWVYFDGSKTTGTQTNQGGCIYVANGKVTIKESTFEGFRAKNGGALYVYKTSDRMRVYKTSTPMTIESTTFKNNEADVRFIYGLAI